MRQALCALFIFCSLHPARAQLIHKQEAALIGYNVAFGGITAGIGGIINKPKGMKWHQAFVRSLWQGAVGGSLSYTGKRMNYLITRYKQPAFGWPSKIIHAAGTSIIYSAALNREFLKYWSIDYGPARFDISLKESPACRVRFMPGSILSFLNANYYAKLDLKTSLLCGNIAYKRDSYTKLGPYTVQGIAFNHAFVYVTYPSMYNTIAHELNHLYQFRDYLVFNTYTEPVAVKIKKKKWGSLLNRFVYIDMYYFNALYLLEAINTSDNPQCYYDNFFELEAERLTINKDLYRCK